MQNLECENRYQKGYCDGYEKGYTRAMMDYGIENDPEEDTVSRKAVIDLLKSCRQHGQMIPWEGKNIFSAIRALPIVKPKIIKGKWIPFSEYHGDDISGFTVHCWKCSVCGNEAPMTSMGLLDLSDYCPGCGAHMEGKR